MATEEEARTPSTIAGCELWVDATGTGKPRECATEDGRRHFKSYLWHVLHMLAVHRRKTGTSVRNQSSQPLLALQAPLPQQPPLPQEQMPPGADATDSDDDDDDGSYTSQ